METCGDRSSDWKSRLREQVMLDRGDFEKCQRCPVWHENSGIIEGDEQRRQKMDKATEEEGSRSNIACLYFA